jgi:hypothetical protein
MEAGGIEPPQSERQPGDDSSHEFKDSSAKPSALGAHTRSDSGPEMSRKKARSPRKTGPGPVSNRNK